MKTFAELSRPAQECFQTIHWLLISPSRQQEIYRTAFTADEKERLFSPQQRNALTGAAEDLDLGGLEIDLRETWREVSGHPIPRSDLELAYRVDLITESTYRWLMEELDEEVQETSSSITPAWNEQTGELRFQEKVIRRVRGTHIAANVVAILNEFQNEGWRQRIDNPLKDRSSQKLRETIASLNTGLEILRFESDGNGAGIRWKVLRSNS